MQTYQLLPNWAKVTSISPLMAELEFQNEAAADAPDEDIRYLDASEAEWMEWAAALAEADAEAEYQARMEEEQAEMENEWISLPWGYGTEDWL